ncbi:hypothetical protein DBR47_09265 [Paucibacter sp. KBW04]|uniref:hypothetical protein n=1 Tax=Paucibacter sp. KBW04 TaxID=2153361 RepID=UPI000F583E33|nr:hypothetical protein [Paucibacter sp. KBW04]RQO60535.1 hypothetical protein DBR47_09265 [Paucibacter sp. KBW04]
MPFLGIGLHILLALFCAVHAVRSGQPLYWLLILFMFPLLGSVVYFIAIYLPDSRNLQRGAQRAVSVATKVIDPMREVRLARELLDATPTAQNQMRLASALLAAGQAQEAAEVYAACLQGPFASDLEVRFGAAQAYTDCQQPSQALSHLDFIRQTNPSFRQDQISLLRARALAGTNQHALAKAEYESAIQRFGSFEAYAEYCIWALGQGASEAATVQSLDLEMTRITKQWTRATREMNETVLKRLAAARS